MAVKFLSDIGNTLRDIFIPKPLVSAQPWNNAGKPTTAQQLGSMVGIGGPGMNLINGNQIANKAQNYFNPSVSGTNGFWGTPVAKGLGSVQQGVNNYAQNFKPIKIIPDNFARINTGNNVVNTVVNAPRDLGVAVGEGIANAPFRALQSGFRIGNDIVATKRNELKMSPGRFIADISPMAVAMLDVYAPKGAANILEQAGKNTFKNVVKEGAIQGAKLGAAINFFDASTSPEQLDEFSLGKTIAPTATGAIGGLVLGGALSAGGYGANKLISFFTDKNIKAGMKPSEAQKDALGRWHNARGQYAKQIGIKEKNLDYMVPAPDGRTMVLKSRLDSTVPGVMSDLEKINKYLSTREGGFLANEVRAKGGPNAIIEADKASLTRNQNGRMSMNPLETTTNPEMKNVSLRSQEQVSGRGLELTPQPKPQLTQPQLPETSPQRILQKGKLYETIPDPNLSSSPIIPNQITRSEGTPQSSKLSENILPSPKSLESSPTHTTLKPEPQINQTGRMSLKQDQQPFDTIIQQAREQIGKSSEKPDRNLKQTFSDLYTQWVDRYNPIIKASQRAKDVIKIKGAELRPEYDPEVLVRRLTGAGGIADARFRRELEPIIKQVDGFKIDKTDLDTYLANKRIAGFGQAGRDIYGADPAK